MGFVLKSAFWLGIVFWAMPLGDAPNLAGVLTPEQEAAACAAAGGALAAKTGDASGAYRGLVAMGCAALVKSVPVAPEPAPKPQPHVLTENDRRPPPTAPPLPPIRPKPG